MATQTFYRKANVSRADATAALFRKFPNVDLVSFEEKTATADEAASCGAQEGEQVFAATIRVAEFPPSDDSGSDDSSDSEESAPAPKKEEKSDESSDSDSDSDSDDSSSDDGGDGAKPEFGAGGPEGHEPKKLSPEEQTVHLLQQILDALKGGAGPAGPGGPDPLGAPDLPDIGAPGQGESLPPAGPAGAGAPLPPPVKQKAPMGAGAFAHVAGEAEVSFVREDASEVGNKAIIAEAAEVLPTHKVAKIQRTGTATINGQDVALAQRNIAVVTLVRK